MPDAKHQSGMRSVSTIKSLGPLLGVTSGAILAIEVFYTRALSILLWSNIAFAALSLAMLGLGTAGLAVFLLPRFFRRERAEDQIAWLMPITGVVLLVSYWLLVVLTRTPVPTWIPYLGMIGLIVVVMLPYFSGGLILSVVFTHFSEAIATLYFWDLVGAALGAALVVPALYAFNGPALVPAIGLLLSATGGAFAALLRRRAPSIAAVAACAFFSLILLVPSAQKPLAIRTAKGVLVANVMRERWDPVARITLTPGPNADTKVLAMDGSALTPVLRFDGNLERMSFIKGSVLQLAYHLKHYPRSLIIGPGGGNDVVAALTFGNHDITAVEVNRSTVSLVKNDLAEYSGGIYSRPDVHVVVGEGRAFVASSDRRYDLIQATFIDTWVAASTGSHTLSEDYLYTIEGLHDFLSHLEPDGVFSASRWGGERFGYLETYRIVGIAIEALKQLGVSDPARHILVVQGPQPEHLLQGPGYQWIHAAMDAMSTILVKRSPFSAEEAQKLQRVSAQYFFRPLWLAGQQNPAEEPVLRAIFDSKDKAAFFAARYREMLIDCSPTTDDRPFFFDMLKPQDYLRFKSPAPGDWRFGRMYVGIQMLYQLLVALLVVVAALLGIPLALRSGAAAPSWSLARVIGYFVCLGLGFIGIELGLIQKFSLFLGHPMYSLVVSLAAILFFSGVGSYSARRLSGSDGVRRIFALVVLLALYSVAIRPLTTAWIAWPFASKCLVAIVLTGAPAFLMGTLFPLGIAQIADRRLIPWAWAVNSGFSVLGGILSLYVSMGWGYSIAWYAFTLIYLVAGVILLRWLRHPSGSVSAT
jgi:predicted membrane-bound spermidine synthase